MKASACLPQAPRSTVRTVRFANRTSYEIDLIATSRPFRQRSVTDALFCAPLLTLLLRFQIATEMSFFGFDTTLPRDKRGIFENPDPFAEVARARAEGLDEDDA